MKKTIRIIDLILKVANEEKVPENIKYDNKVMKYDHNKQDYKGYYSNGNGDYLFQFLFDKCRNTEHFINDYVEIIDEEEFIDIEEITLNGEKLGYGVLSKWLGSKQTDNEAKLCSSIECLGIILNLLIKNQKKIIERLNKEN